MDNRTTVSTPDPHYGSVASLEVNIGPTKFIDDAMTKTTEFPAERSAAYSLGTRPVVDPTLSNFLARPVVMDTGTWNASYAAGDDIDSFSIGQVLGNEPFLSKLAGVALFRATVCIRVVINAQPFTQGRCIARVFPYYTQHPTGVRAARDLNLTTKSQMPNVEIDCRDTSGTIKIPWIGPAPWLDVKNQQVTWGYFMLTCLSPVATGATGDNTVTYTIYAWFEDCEFGAFTIPQSGVAPKPRRKNIKMKNASPEVDLSQDKPVSTVLNAASRVLELCKGVPLISGYADTAQWITRSAANLASAFGWAKPNSMITPGVMTTRPYRFNGNCNGPCYPEKLAMNSDASISQLPGFAGTDVDEMSFDYLKMIPAYVGTFAVEMDAAVGTSLAAFNLGPRTCVNGMLTGTPDAHTGWISTSVSAIGATGKYITGPAFAHLAACFAYYRGSIKLHFKFVKTQFHSGRIQITWTSYDEGTPGTVPTTVTSAYSYREIIDLRETTDVTIEFPYLLPRVWQTVQKTMGRVNIQVLNSPVGPATAASSIDCVVFASAGEDFEFSGRSSIAAIPMIPQAGDAIDGGVIGDESLAPPGMVRFTCSDDFKSVKQLISQMCRVWYTRTATTLDKSCQWTWSPFSVYAMFLKASEVPVFSPTAFDTYSLIASGFALRRGGMRVGFSMSSSSVCTADWVLSPCYEGTVSAAVPSSAFVSSSATVPATAGLSYGANTVSDIPATWGNFYSQLAPGNALALFMSSSGGVEVEVPQIHMNPSCVIPIDSDSTGIFGQYSDTLIQKGFLSVTTENTHTYTKLYRAASDDHQLGYFIGFLPWVIEYH